MRQSRRKTRKASSRKTYRTVSDRRNSKDTLNIEFADFYKIVDELHKYKQMVDLANHGCVIVDMKGNLLYVNDSFAKMHGYDARRLLGKNLKIFHDARQLKYVRTVLDRMKKTGKGLNNQEFWRKRCDGTVFPTLTNIWLLKDKSGHPAMFCATMVDISEQRKREAELAASKRALEAMLNASGEAVGMVDRDVKIVEINERMADLLGKPREELIGRCAWDCMSPKGVALRRPIAEKILSAGKPVTYLDEGYKGRFYNTTGYPLKDADRKVTGMVLFAKDVTQHKKAEEELKIYKQLVDTANHGLSFADLKGNLLYINETFARMHGYSASELTGKNIKIFYNTEQLKIVRPDVESLVKTGKGFNNKEVWHTHRNGAVFPTLMNTWAIKGKDGRPTVICATAADISSLRQREKDLETSKKTQQAMLNASGEAIAMVDRDVNLIDVNERMADALGWPREKLIGRCALDFMPPKVAAARRPIAEQVIATGKPITVLNDDGKGRIYSSSYYPLKGPDGKVTRMVIFAKDVTQQKKAEAGLEAGKNTLEAMLNATTDLVALMDKDLKYVDMNDKMAKGLKMPKEQLIGRYSLDLMEPEAAALRRAKAKEAMVTGKPVTFEHESHGSIFIASCYPVTGAGGKITGVVVFARDITARKKAEAGLVASKKTLETMLNATNDLVAMIDGQCNVVEVNKKMADAFDRTREELIGRCAWDFHTPEIAAQRRAKVEHVMAAGKAMTFVDSVEDGKTYSNSCYPLKDLDGKVTGMVVFSKDITEQKKAQEDLETSYKTLETMLNASGDAVTMLDRDINFIEMNEQMADAFEQPKEKLIGRCAWDCMPPEAAALRRPIAEHILATGKPTTYFDEDGKGRVYSTTGYPLKASDGKITGIVVFAKDVTQHKKAEEELSHYREELFRLRRSTYLDLFSSIIMHQISQPLTIMDMLLDDTLSEINSGKFEKGKVTQVLEKCLRETNSAVEAIQKTREHSSQFTKSQIKRFNPGQVIRNVISTLESKASQAKVKIEVADLKSLPVISGYQDALEQIVLSITENAIEAADRKKQHRLDISVNKTDNHIELVFCDDCCGIPGKNLEKIYEPFFSTKVRRGSKCLGLGLPIVRRILMAMGGEIRVKSEIGKGTTFYVNWPLV